TQAVDKRTRLVEAAARLTYEQGFNQTTLADIAGAADVPVGNVYYYFKTKDAIGEAVVEERLAQQRVAQRQWEEQGDARHCLTRFVQMTLNNRRALAGSGCPIGSLCSELHKEDGPLAEQASSLFADWLAWLEEQFRALGQGDESGGLAVHMMSVLQGATVLTHSFRHPRYVEAEARRLLDWIGTL
ncbi:MAG: TetR/AcrR family transcriptional regulator, partial [Actinobacteria bacterium]|nr:TetR/AcrR family transcriptional regulator [Actinomycetota bacterium]